VYENAKNFNYMQPVSSDSDLAVRIPDKALLVRRLQLEVELIRTFWGNIIFNLGFVGFSFLLLYESSNVSVRAVYTAALSRCNDREAGTPYTIPESLLIWSTDEVSVLVVVRAGLLVFVEISDCAVRLLEYQTPLMWFRATLACMFAIQLFIDLYSSLQTPRVGDCPEKHGNTRIGLFGVFAIASSFIFLATLLLDFCGQQYLGFTIDSLISEGLSLLISGQLDALDLLLSIDEFKKTRRVIWCFVFIQGVFRIIKIVSVHPRLSQLLNTVYLGFLDIAEFIVMLSIIYVIFASCAYCLFREELDAFSSFERSLWTQFNMLLTQWPFPELFACSNPIAVYMYTFTFTVVMTLTVLRLYLAVVHTAFNASKTAVESDGIENSVFEDFLLLIREWWLSRTSSWPSRLEVITRSNTESRLLPQLGNMRKFYEEYVLKCPAETGGECLQLREYFRKLNSASNNSIQNEDPHEAAVRELRKSLKVFQVVGKSSGLNSKDGKYRHKVPAPRTLILNTSHSDCELQPKIPVSRRRPKANHHT
jgi:hypothetical protein